MAYYLFYEDECYGPFSSYALAKHEAFIMEQEDNLSHSEWSIEEASRTSADSAVMAALTPTKSDKQEHTARVEALLKNNQNLS